CFLGCARDFSQGQVVSELNFEAYERMALAEMRVLCDEARVQYGLLGARIVHRVGRILAGENIVLIVTGAEHRAPALQACQWLIDALKERVPIWKKESTPGGKYWVSPRP
ncbi:MAG: molybdopterin biosynthesis protein MoeE, partial [Candidatus Dactylopiibacterium carminicum]